MNDGILLPLFILAFTAIKFIAITYIGCVICFYPIYLLGYFASSKESRDKFRGPFGAFHDFLSFDFRSNF